jgi:hypothetical protein
MTVLIVTEKQEKYDGNEYEDRLQTFPEKASRFNSGNHHTLSASPLFTTTGVTVVKQPENRSSYQIWFDVM